MMSIWFGFAPLPPHSNCRARQFLERFFYICFGPRSEWYKTLVSRTTWYVAKERTVVKRIRTPTCPLICLVRRREFTRIWNAPSFQRVKHATGSGTCACGQTRISMGAFWSIPVNALVSGMEMLVLSLGRKQLRGAVCKKTQMPTVKYRSLTKAQVLDKTSFRTTLSNFASADYATINNSRGGRPIIDKYSQQCLASIRLNPNPPLLQMAPCMN